MYHIMILTNHSQVKVEVSPLTYIVYDYSCPSDTVFYTSEIKMDF